MFTKMSYLILGGFCVFLLFSCDLNNNDDDNVTIIEEKNSLFTLNNALDNELDEISLKYNRKGLNNGIIGEWMYTQDVYDSVPDFPYTRSYFEIEFKENNTVTLVRTNLRRRVSYDGLTPTYYWEYVGLPYSRYGRFILSDNGNEKLITVNETISNSSYMNICENILIRISEKYLVFGDGDIL